MFCKNCGNELKENDVFCGKCGQSVNNNQTSNFVQEVEVIEVEEKEKTIESKTDSYLINVLVALTMVLSIISIITCSRI